MLRECKAEALPTPQLALCGSGFSLTGDGASKAKALLTPGAIPGRSGFSLTSLMSSKHHGSYACASYPPGILVPGANGAHVCPVRISGRDFEAGAGAPAKAMKRTGSLPAHSNHTI